MKRGAAEPVAALNRVKICESGEPLVDIREFCPLVEPLEKVCPYLRLTVAEMLNSAVRALPQGYRFRIGTALRTITMQRRGWDAYFERMKAEHPGWPLSALRRATNRYYAPYDQPTPPGHCTGGAVDVILLDPVGEPADVTSPTTDWVAACTWCDKISPEARRNRMILVDAMLGAGFSNCREEYWHYSWGDSAWAVRVGERSCPYGWVDPPVAVESSFEGGRAGKIEHLGSHAWRCHAQVEEDEPSFQVGVFWAHSRVVELEFAPNLPDVLYASEDHERWQPWEGDRDLGAHRILIAPQVDRLFLSTLVPAQTQK